MKEKLYYLKWDIDNESFLLDVSYRSSDFVYGIRKVHITEFQANEFGAWIEKRYINKGKFINITILEYEFDKFFHICEDCGKATSHTTWVKRQRNWCYDCYHGHLNEIYREKAKIYIENERIKRLQEYVKTNQGIADVIGAKVIKANVYVQLKKHNKTQKELAQVLGLTEESVSRLFNNRKSVKIEYLYKIAEWLFVPMDLLLAVPRGTVPLKRKNGIPILIYHKPMKTVKYHGE